jgi:hypothetical protein
MKLGVAVVYLVDQDDSGLLDIHLSQIQKLTSVPYCIYAAANRLLPRFREKLERLPLVKICSIPDTDLRGRDEHPYYLEFLVKAAVEDGATHICTFHVDSFPVQAGWAEEIAGRLHGPCVLAAVQRDPQTDRKPVTEFMMFTREFYLSYRPTFRLPESILASAAYKRYLAECPHTPDSGVGYGFAIWSAQLSWFPLERVDRGKNRYYCGGIYGELVFHLGGAVLYRARAQPASRGQIRTADVLSVVRRATLPILPAWLRRRVLGSLGLERWIEAHFTVPALESAKAELLKDPEQYLRRIRSRR